MRLAFFILILTASIQISMAQMAFSQIQLAGTGCPQHSTDIITSPDGQSLSLLFNEMYIELPQYDGNNDNNMATDGHRGESRRNKYLVQKVCNILIEADIPHDHKVDALEVSLDLRGSTYMDPGATAIFQAQLIKTVGPQRRSQKRKDFIGRRVWRDSEVDEDWIISSNKRIEINSACSRRGDSKNVFNLQNIMRARISGKGQQNDANVFIGLDSADLVGKIKIKVHHSSCRRSGGSVTPSRPRNPRNPRRPRNPRSPRQPRRDRPVIDNPHCPRGLIFHRPSGQCLSKRQIARWG